MTKFFTPSPRISDNKMWTNKENLNNTIVKVKKMTTLNNLKTQKILAIIILYTGCYKKLNMPMKTMLDSFVMLSSCLWA